MYNAATEAVKSGSRLEREPADQSRQEESTTEEAKEENEATPATVLSEPEIEIAGVVNWNRPSGIAFGAATSLYERHPVSGETAGNPLADVSSIQYSTKEQT